MIVRDQIVARDPIVSPQRYPWLGVGVIAALAFGYLATSDELTRDALYALRMPIVIFSILLGVRLFGARPRGAWLTITTGLSLLFVDELANADAAATTLTESTMSFVAHALIVVGAAWLLRHLLRGSSYLGVLEAAIITVAAYLVLWRVVFDPVIDAWTGAPLELVGQLAVPLLSALGVAVMIALAFSPARKTPFAWFMILANASLSLGNVVQVASVGATPPPIIDASVPFTWLGTGFAVAAVLHRSIGRPLRPRKARADRLGFRRLALLAMATLVAPVVLVLVSQDGASAQDVAILTLGGAIMSILLVLRLSGANRLLLQSTRDRLVAEHALRSAELHDSMTGLPNRMRFAQRLGETLARSTDGVAIFFCDLDDFKAINDMLGHGTGDSVLGTVAHRLPTYFRKGDLVARLGGDEFAILVHGVSDPAAGQRVAERIIRGLGEPLAVDDRSISVQVSVGVALASGPSVDAQQLMREADIAMYVAKSEGKARAVVYGDQMREEVVRHLQIQAGLDHAAERKELTVVYQPVVDLETSSIRGAEALMRWQHPLLGRVGPDEFIPIAESEGTIVALGRWVLREACRSAAAWRAPGGGRLPVAVNVSARQLTHPGFVDDVRRAMADFAMTPGDLVLEVTETAIADLDVVAPRLRELRELGARVSIDDFGTGYSSLGYLSRLPLDSIKIDRMFVDALGRSDADAAMTSTVIELGRKLQVEVIAEGIETLEQAEQLSAQGCRLGQGYLYGRPMSAAELEDALRRDFGLEDILRSVPVPVARVLPDPLTR